MIVFVKNSGGIEVVINHNASSFVDLLWRGKYLSQINTPKI
jgi:hypothetical protein